MMKQRFLLLLFMLLPLGLQARSVEQLDRNIVKHTFIPKGQWIVGGNFSYTKHNNDDYKFVVLDNWSGKGYTMKFSPFVGYALRNDLVLGGRFAYSRNMQKIDNMDIDLSDIIDSDDLDLNLNQFYKLSHNFYTSVFLRNYINLGESKRFALFNDTRITYGYGEGKLLDGSQEALTGTMETTNELQIGMNPGVVAFLNDFVAVEVNIGVMGFNMKWVDQTTDRIYKGSYRSSVANFKINIFSIGLGIAFYL